MVRGAILVSHDYNQVTAGGVKQAFTEFFADKAEPILALWDIRCVFVKT